MADLKKPPRKIDAFINGGSDEVSDNEPEAQNDYKTVLPWEGKNEEIMKGINLRLNQVQHEKLKFVFKHSTEKSIQKFIMSVLEPAIEEKIREILNP